MMDHVIKNTPQIASIEIIKRHELFEPIQVTNYHGETMAVLSVYSAFNNNHIVINRDENGNIMSIQ